MEENWVKVYSSSKLYEIELIRGLLKENNIESVTMDKQDSAYLFGVIELYVNVENAFRAKQLIEQNQSE